MRLGLIGDNIAASKAPRLHAVAGRMRGLDVAYDLLVPAEQGVGFDELFERCADGSYRGINVTHSYKERAAKRVEIESPLVRAMGAVNTMLFEPTGPRGFNTDHTGFIAAWRAAFGAAGPGTVCQVGAGGVGKAVAFGLAELGAECIRVVDIDHGRAEALAATVREAHPADVRRPAEAPRPATEAVAAASLEEASNGARGIVNCSPVGMVGHGGTPVPPELMRGAAWAFDAVYTPVDTRFLADAAAAGLDTLNGYELFFHQGAECTGIFLGGAIDRTRLWQALQDPG